jgi:hypothetical protein
MSFISGLKDLFKKPRYVIVVFTFIILWILILLGRTQITNQLYRVIIVEIIQVFIGAMIFLLFASFFRPIDKINWKIILLILVLVLLFHFFILRRYFSFLVSIFFNFSLIANIAITAFFAFKLWLDLSTNLDEYLIKKPHNKITRSLEFLIFGILAWIVLFFSRRFLMGQLPNDDFVLILFIIQWVNIILIAFVLVRLIFLQKFSAFITLFLALASAFFIYLVFDLISGDLFTDNRGFLFLSFIVDVFLFIFILGSLFDKIEYLNEKLKILRSDTIALFFIAMKAIVQLTYLLKIIPGIPYQFSTFEQELFLLLTYIGFILLFGLYSIFAYDTNKKSEPTSPIDDSDSESHQNTP